MSIPIALLCYRQFQSPADDVINQSYGHSNAMLVAEGIVRTSGTFTVSSAQTLFVGSILAMLLSVWLMPRTQRPLGKIGLWFASFAVLTTLAVSGARSALFLAIPIVLAAMVGMLVTYRSRAGLKPLIIVPALICVGPSPISHCFPPQLVPCGSDKWRARWQANLFREEFIDLWFRR